nr:uncharacterized protein LOC109157277 [Ipomoea batatas]
MKLKRDTRSWAVIDFRYEHLPTFCFLCGVIGHGEKICPKIFQGMAPTLDKPYGPWLRAGGRRAMPLAGRGSGDQTVEPDIPSTVSAKDGLCVEQKKRRFDECEVAAGASVSSITCPYSDHLPILLTPTIIIHSPHRRRFCFDNMWLWEDICHEIVEHSWSRKMGLNILDRVEVCSYDLWRWGRNYNKDFLKRIDWCKNQLNILRDRRDAQGTSDYDRVEKQLLILLEQQHTFWKQRVKEHWWRGRGFKNQVFP